jgi:Cytochrome c554 and c-prime
MLAYVVALMMLAPAPQGAGQPGAANPCVTCHQGLAAPQAAAHSFSAWRASAHGATVTCDRCHGGDTTATEERAAHRDVYPATDYRSMVHPTRVPVTCGACHQQELGFFIGSRHAGRLQAGAGPSCVTCHGSMAVHTLTAAGLDTVCAACHRAGGTAPAATIDTARALLTHLRQTDSTRQAAVVAAGQLANARARSRAQGHLEEARDLLGRAREGWHAFDLGMVRRLLIQADSVLVLAARRE